MKIIANSVSDGLNKLSEIIAKKMVNGVTHNVSQSLNDNIQYSLPDVTGNVRASFTPNKIPSGKRQVTISRFNSKAPELLERGTSSRHFPSAPYRVYNPAWVNAKGLQNKFHNGYFYVGNPSTTSWGSASNKWFTKSTDLTRSEMSELIKNIKIEA